jgi:hypothetical protein
MDKRRKRKVPSQCERAGNLMELKHTVQTYIVVEYHDLDDFITKHFSFPREKTFMDKYSEEPEDGIYREQFEFVAIEEGHNSSSYTYQVDGELDEWDKKDIKKMLAAKKFDSYSTRMILDYLASEGVIIKGDYSIHVFW